ncbi:APC family permease [bacterium]|nr:MAG: APC family permease [bacterium]
MRKTMRPPPARASSHASSAVRAFPRCIGPVGLGAKRPRRRGASVWTTNASFPARGRHLQGARMAVTDRALKRVLSLRDLAVIGSASMAPAYSLAATLGLMVAAAGYDAPLALLMLCVPMTLVAFAFGHLVRAHPSAGSSYAWIRMAFGRGVGSYGAWTLLCANFFATMATAWPAATYTLALLAPERTPSAFVVGLVAMVWIVAASALLYAGARPTAEVSAAMLAAEFAVLGALVVAILLHPSVAPAHAVLRSFHHTGFAGVLGAAVLSIWVVDGWEASAASSEERLGASREPGLAGVTALAVTAVALALFATVALRLGTVDGYAKHSADAMEYVAQQLGGGLWLRVVAATVLVSSAASLFTTMLYLSRSAFAMARDGVLPRRLAHVHPRLGTPDGAILGMLIVTVISTGLAGLSPSVNVALNAIVDASSVFLGALFVLSALACAAVFAPHARGLQRLRTVTLPLLGALWLGAIVVYGVVGADGVQRWIAASGLILGVPFALLRRGAAGVAVAEEAA